jgi:hypothetical protein
MASKPTESVIRQSLDEIANEVGAALRDARLDFPVGLTIPSSGYALITMATPVDPSDDDLSQATAIVRHIVSSDWATFDCVAGHYPARW